jgi:hypothetical protein
MEVPVRERGVQSRRARAAESGTNPTGSSSGGGPGYWPIVAIIAVIVATAGWTTVGVMVMNSKPGDVASVPSASDEPIDEEESPPDDEAPVPESHTFPDLEALLPTEADGTKLTVQSFTGADVLVDDAWGTSVTQFLTSIGKTPTDLQAARAEDPDGVIDLDSIWAFRVAGVKPETLRDAIVNGWRVDFPDLTTSNATIEGKDVMKGSFGEDAIGSIWYIHDGIVYDIESYDEALATSILASLPPSTAPATSPAASPAASSAASASPAP